MDHNAQVVVMLGLQVATLALVVFWGWPRR